MAERYDWMPDTFAALFQSEIVRGQEAAQKAEEERKEQEEQAAQTIQEEQAPAGAGRSGGDTARPAGRLLPRRRRADGERFAREGGGH